jgi:uncharacterized phage protein gp47/JayE
MVAMAGVTPAGFEPKSFDQILEEIRAELRARFGPNVNLSPGSTFSLLSDILAAKLSEVWDVIADVVMHRTLEGAEGVWLDDIAAMVGLTRLLPTATKVDVQLYGTPGTIVPAGTRIRVAGTTTDFLIESDTTIAGSGIGNGVAVCSVTGPIAVNANSVWEIVTPVTGLDSVQNQAAGRPGRNLETDTELRNRIITAPLVIGRATVDTIRSRILQLEGVTYCNVIENTSLSPDSDGRPGKSFEVVVSGGEDQEIADTIWLAKPVGIQVYSTASPAYKVVRTVTDDMGNLHQIEFSRPEAVPIWIDVGVQVSNEENPPLNLFAEIKESLRQEVAKIGIGNDVIIQRLIGAVVRVKGVANTVVLIGTSSPPTQTTNIAIPATKFAEFDLDNRLTIHYI